MAQENSFFLTTFLTYHWVRDLPPRLALETVRPQLKAATMRWTTWSTATQCPQASLRIFEKLFQMWGLETSLAVLSQMFPTEQHNAFGSARSVHSPQRGDDKKVYHRTIGHLDGVNMMLVKDKL